MRAPPLPAEAQGLSSRHPLAHPVPTFPALIARRVTQTADQAAGVTRAKTYVQGSDKDVLCGFFVNSINEWKIAQPRVIVLTHSAYYRVTYSHKYGRIDHYHKTPLNKLRVLEKTATGIKIYLTEQDGNASIGKKLSGWFSKKQEKDEFEHVREYLPAVPTSGPGLELLCDAIAASMHKAAELCSKSASGGGFPVPTVLTTDGRKQILADRKEAAKLELERVEREAATKELADAVAAAKATRDAAPPAPEAGGSAAMASASKSLEKPLKRAKKAVDFPAEALSEAEGLKAELDEAKKERETAERLERERLEREAASEELANAVEAAKESRDAKLLEKPLKRAKKAVDFPADVLGAAETLKADLEAEKIEKDRKEAEDARLELERVEREAATKELADAVAAAKATRDAAPPAPEAGGSAAMASASKSLEKPLKRAKKAVDFPAEALSEAEGLKAELDEAKKERETAERLERERLEREAAQAELAQAIAECEESRDPTSVVKALKRAKKAVDADAELITKGEGLKAACDDEKAAAAKAAKDEAAAAKAAAKDEAAAAKAKAEADKAAKAAEEAAAKAAAAAATAEAAPAAAPEPEAASEPAAEAAEAAEAPPAAAAAAAAE